MLKYLDRGERILKRTVPRIDLPSTIDDAAPPHIRREFRRVIDNLCRFGDWIDGLPGRDVYEQEMGDSTRYFRFPIEADKKQWISVEPNVDAPLAAHWAHLSYCLQGAAEELEQSRCAKDATARLRDARYYLHRMRVLTCRSAGFSSMLTFEELADDLAANGIVGLKED